MSYRAGRVAVLAGAMSLAVFTIANAAAEPSGKAVLHLDPASTTVAFRLPGSLHDTHGTFHLKEGTVEIDTATTGAGGLVVVDASSGETGNSSRDARMRDVVLESERFPEIRFRPARVVGTLGADGSFRATVEGTFTLHGTDHPMTSAIEGRLDGQRVTATCRFSVPYVEWGLKDPSLLFLTVGKEVEIDVTATGDLTWKSARLEPEAPL
jgi:polyisoprenoid-binding protein YceI